MEFRPSLSSLGGTTRFSDSFLNSYRKYIITVSVALLLLAVVPMAASAQQSGSEIYSSQCESCHAADGTGTGLPNQPDFTNADFWEAENKEELREAVSGGLGAMPAFSDLSDEELDNVLTHEADMAGVDFSSLPEGGGGGDTGGATPTPTIEGDADRGRALFTGEASLENGGPACISCHDVQGVGQLGGGKLARDLTNVYDRFGAGLNAWLGTTPVPLMQDVYGGDKQLSSQDRADLVAFFQQVNDRDPAGGANTAKFAGAGVIGFIVIAVIFAILWRNRFAKKNGGTVHDDLWRNYGGKK